jgi:hypothetical protein
MRGHHAYPYLTRSASREEFGAHAQYHPVSHPFVGLECAEPETRRLLEPAQEFLVLQADLKSVQDTAQHWIPDSQRLQVHLAARNG